jgi:hypothetical protein
VNQVTIPCPQGCGGTVTTGLASEEILVDEAGVRYRIEGEGINVCPSCRRHVDEVQTPFPGMCWSWFGPQEHRMRCRRPAGHGPEDRPGTTWMFPVDGHDCSYDEREWATHED